MTQQIIIPYSPRPLQAEFHRQQRRFSVAVCHRRFGKTVMAINWLLKEILTSKRKNAKGAYIAQNYGSAKRISWQMLRDYAETIPGVKFNEAELRCDLPGGKTIYLLGAENPDSLRGMGLVAVCLDEYADMNARLYPEIIRPSLSDYGDGRCLWIGTPRGDNQFKEIYDHAISKMEDSDPEWFAMRFPASETGVLGVNELQAARDTMDESQYQQEYEVSWSAALIGSYWANAIDKAEAEKRICPLPWDPALKVHTVWDLGLHDSTCIIYFQLHKSEIRIINCFEASGEGLHFYIRELQSQPYLFEKHFFPHDVMVRELSTGSSRYEMLMALGVRPTVVAKLTVQDGIEAVRAVLPRCYFDRENTKPLLKALRHYHRTFNTKTSDWNAKPVHDWSSHFADCARYLAVGLRDDGEDEDYRNMARTGMMAPGKPVIDGGDGVFG